MKLGLKAHWRDVDAMVAIAKKHGATALEYQMLLGDLEASNAQSAFEAFLPHRDAFELRIHQPEFFAFEGQTTFLDISSPDAAIRDASVAFLAECARHAMELRAKALIIHPGGLWRGNVGGGPDILRHSLQDFPRHVKLLLENMPYFGPDGDFPAAFRVPAGLLAVDDLVDGFVLDISHAYLAVPDGSEAVVRAFVKELGPRVMHVHANGSRGGVGPSGEGTPFTDSDYGEVLVREVLAGVSPDAVVVPEILDGHLDGAKKFDDGLAWINGAMAKQ